MKALAWLLLAVLLAPLAAAQVPSTSVSLRIDVVDGNAEVAAGNGTTLVALVANDGGVGGTVTLTVKAPAGWTATAEQTSFTLAAGNSANVKIALTAPAAGAGAAAGDLTIQGTLTDVAGRAANAQDVASLARIDPPPAPPAPPLFSPLEKSLLGGLGALLLLGVGAVLVQRTRHQRALAAALVREREERDRQARLARETGIAVGLLDGPVPFGNGRESMLRLRVENQSDRPRVALVGVREAEHGWRVSVSVSKIALSPGEWKVVTAHVVPPPNALLGQQAQATFFAKPEEAQEREELLTVQLASVDVNVPVSGGLQTRGHRVDPLDVRRR